MRAALVVLLLAGCATETKMYSANGSSQYFIECDAISRCVSKAKKVCPEGFEILTKDNGGFFSGPPTMTIACKA